MLLKSWADVVEYTSEESGKFNSIDGNPSRKFVKVSRKRGVTQRFFFQSIKKQFLFFHNK